MDGHYGEQLGWGGELERVEQGAGVQAKVGSLADPVRSAVVLHHLEGLERVARVAPGLAGSDLDDALDEKSLRSLGMTEMYVLTTTAPRYFERHRFEVVERERAPSEVQATREYRGLCPKSAVRTKKTLPEGAQYLPSNLLPLRPDIPGARMWGVGLERALMTYFEVDPGVRFEMHQHDGEQITTVIEGELLFESGGTVTGVRAGDATAIPPGIPHAVYTKDRDARAFDAWLSPPPAYRRTRF